MTAEQLEELLGKVTEWPPVSGHETAHDAMLISIAERLARRVIAAEYVVAALKENHGFTESQLSALTAYREASK